MKKIQFAIALLILTTSSAYTAKVCSCDSAFVAIDLTPGTRTAAPVEAISYSTEWETDEVGATAIVSVNGVVLSAASGSGTTEWHPPCNGTFTLTHKVIAGGAQIGETLTATFNVDLSPATPEFSPASGTVFSSSLSVSISCATEGAVIHYTTDGTDPTEASPVYRRFRITGPTTVKAIAIWNGQTSEIAVASYDYGQMAAPTIKASSYFTGSETKVEISCTTDGATIRYTIDGTEPNASSAIYRGPFYITNSCTVKAYATCFDHLNSAVASFAIEKVWGIGDTLGAPDQVFSTGGNLPFVRVTDNTAPLGESMKSGAITHSQTSTLSTTVMGPGTISFQWKASCEDSGGEYDWDHAEFRVDGALVAQLDGQTAWQTVTQAISGGGSHTLLWKYIKDNVESEGEDCCWVADYHWASAYTATQTTEVPVPYVWLRDSFPHTPDEYDAYESAAKELAANGVNKVWECYVAGLNPTKATDVFRTVISMEGGRPVISWAPDLNAGGTKQERVYCVFGRSSLTEGDWSELRIENGELRIGECRFFRVRVEMP